MASQQEQELRSQLRQARERVDGLVRELHAVDAELEGLSSDREQHRLLHEACDALEALSELGAVGLFWGEQSAARGEEHVRRVRARIDHFQKRVEQIESRREEILGSIGQEEGNAEFLAADVLEAQWREEQRQFDWEIERDIGPLPAQPTVMPWARGGEDDRRFRKSLAASLLLALLLGLLLPLVDLPVPESWTPVEVPERLTRLLREERPAPPPPPTVAETRPEELKPEATEESPAPEPVPQKTASKERARSQGILAFREQFSGLASSVPADRLGAKARIAKAGEAGGARLQRSMVTTMAARSSGGIPLGSLSRDMGGGGEGIAGVEVARATSSIGAIGGSDRPLSGGPGAGRTDEEIQIVFDRHKAALYRLYNRELRRNPTLQGQMVLRLTIEPDGSVSLCELHSTDMKAPQLSAQVLARVRNLDFGAKEGIPAVTILYPIDFLPAA